MERLCVELGVSEQIALFLSKWMIGHRIYPFRVLWWFAALVLGGWLALTFAAPSGVSGPTRRFWYSFENALPLVELAESHRHVPLEGWVENFFHAQKVLGFVLVTVLVGALTLVGA